jgi:uncharacterized protein
MRPPRLSPGQLARDMTALRTAVAIPVDRLPRPVFVATVGLPGTGKSHFAGRLAAKVPLVHLESDRLRAVLFRNPTHGYKESRRLFRAIHALAEELIASGHSVLLDATNLREEHRADLKSIADRSRSRFFLVELRAPEGLVIQRLKGRELRQDQAGVEVYTKLRDEVQPIRLEHRSVDTSWDITTAVDELAGELLQNE